MGFLVEVNANYSGIFQNLPVNYTSFNPENMETKLEQIRDQQKESWNHFSPGWKKWDDWTMRFLKPFGEEIIRMLSPRDGQHILDVATGTGEPGLTMAKMMPNGKVTGIDNSEGMLEVAKEHSVAKGIRNYDCLVADVSELPFEDSTFDHVSCRMGFMFFPDMKMALSEMVRVLKPGGKICASVWTGPESNPWITIMLQSISQFIEVQPPPPGAPGMFRCAAPGLMKNIFTSTGLMNVSEKVIDGTGDFETAQKYWESLTELSAPFVAVLSKADENTVTKIREKVYVTVKERCQDGNVRLPMGGIVITGEKAV